jgi:hypothetical protein
LNDRCGGASDDRHNVNDKDVHVAVVVKVADGAPTAGLFDSDCSPNFLRDLLESPVAKISVELLRLEVRRTVSEIVDPRMNMAVRHEDVQLHVIVEVDEAGSPAQMLKRGCGQTCSKCFIGKESGTVGPVKGIGVVREMRHEDVEQAIVVVVRDVESPSRLWTSFSAEGDTGRKTDFGKCAVPVVFVQSVGNRVIGHKDIEPPSLSRSLNTAP